MTGAREPYDALDLSPFAGLPAEVWSPALHDAEQWIEAAIVARAIELTRRVGPDEVAPERTPLWDWLQRLIGERQPRIVPEPPAGLGTTPALIERAAAAWPDVLTGRADGRRALRGADALALWEGYFDNANLAYAPVNRLTAFAADAVLDGREDLRVLEVGAGCGSATEALLERLGDRVASLQVTDVAPPLLTRARRRLSAGWPDALLSYGALDLDRMEGAAAPAFDVLLAVNTLHAVADLSATLAALREQLQPGGWLVLGEAVRPLDGRPVPIEWVFLLSPEFRRPRADGAIGFMSWPAWQQALGAAGFVDLRCWPDIAAAGEAYPGWSLAAIAARGA